MERFSRVLLLLAVGFFAGASAQELMSYPSLRAAYAGPNSNHTIIQQALQAANLSSLLDDSTGATIFAPTDAAFVAALEALKLTPEALLASPLLLPVLQYHVTETVYPSLNELANAGTLMTASNMAINVTRTGDAITLVAVGSNATVIPTAGMSGLISSSANGTNQTTGAFYAIDAVLLPMTLEDIVAMTMNMTMNTTANATDSTTDSMVTPMKGSNATNTTAPVTVPVTKDNTTQAATRNGASGVAASLAAVAGSMLLLAALL